MYTILVIARPTRQQFAKSHVDVRWEENREMATAEATQFLKQNWYSPVVSMVLLGAGYSNKIRHKELASRVKRES